MTIGKLAALDPVTGESAPNYHLHIGEAVDALRKMPTQSVHTVVTSPPYFGLRDYGVDGQLGLEKTPDEYVESLVTVFREVRRVLRDDGTLWLNLGDTYSSGGRKYRDGDDKLAQRGMATRPDDGAKPKDLLGIPWRVAFALQADGWYLRQDIIWHKPNPMPESVRDRCTKAHEYIFLLSKSPKYYYDHEAVKEPAQQHSTKAELKAPAGVERKTRNRRSVWTVNTKPYRGAHFATFPPSLIEPCVLAGCPKGGTVLDPFAGSGTVAGVALAHERNAILIELNPEYAELIPERVSDIAGSGDNR